MDIEIAGPGTFAVDVVGVSHRQHVLEAAAAHGQIIEATLVLEDDNPHDPKAVAVRIGDDLCGYISRADARCYRADLAAAGVGRVRVRCKARITGGFIRADGERAHYGLKLDLPAFSGGG